jgi:FkbM family methyltransferase
MTVSDADKDAGDAGNAGPKPGRQNAVGRFKLRKARARGVLEGLCAGLNESSVVVDCGANVGAVSVPLARTGARVIAFEPDLLAHAALSEAAAGLANVELHQAAVGVEAGEVSLYRAEKFETDPLAATVSSSVMTGKRGQSDENAITVPQIDLPAFLTTLVANHGRVDFLKLDIEGSELDLLPALADAGLLENIRYVAAETHERKFPERRREFLAMRSRIEGAFGRHHINLNWI